jgi:hypothetical protein
LSSAWGIIKHWQTTQISEAISCYEGLRLAIVESGNQIIVEKDCQAILPAFDPRGDDLSDIRFIADDFNRLISEGKIVKIVYKSRKANLLAHEIAKYANKVLCDGVLQGQDPTSVSELALHDCKTVLAI